MNTHSNREAQKFAIEPLGFVCFVCSLVFENDDVHFPTEGGAGVQRDHPGAVVGTEIRVRPELGAFAFISRVAIGTMPVAAEDRLLFRAGLRRVHPVYPPRPAPFFGRGLAPVGAMAVTAVTLLDAGNPAVHENVMRGLIIVYHRRNDLSIIGCVLRRLGARFMMDTFLSDDVPFESFLER